MENNIFNVEKLKNALPKEPIFTIGIDTYDKNNSSYCLIKKTGPEIEILLCKTIKGESEFKEEVNNLAKYFNAIIIKEQ